MILQSWGRYPQVKEQSLVSFENETDYQESLADQKSIICYGNGRSYGDSALNERILYSKSNNLILDFDKETGVLQCQAGILLNDILNVFVNRGWFLAVTPGTKYVTVGGAISADVHGKNQQLVGSFCDFVISFKLALADGSIAVCSQESNKELFEAACGGMGLMGIILDVTLQLKRISSSFMEQVIIRTNCLAETLDVFEDNRNASYSVAWVDCFAASEKIGRAVVSLAEHAEDGELCWQPTNPRSLPFHFSGLLLNKYTGSVFNKLYYFINRNLQSRHKVAMNEFFYPLDGIKNWNKLYGQQGFIQYQFVIPKVGSLNGLTEILTAISNYPKGAFLSVLKLFGKGNENYLSFPMEGYTLAIDFKVTPELLPFLELLDAIVLKYNGRFYLAKDSRLSRESFENGYPNVDIFRELRKKYALKDKFQSYQSKRLAL